MFRLTIIFFTFLTVFMLSSSGQQLVGAAENIQCSTVAMPDLRNAKIGVMTFVDGKTCTSDGLAGGCDWEHTISKDEILRPAPEKDLRLIVINANHLTGSGLWDTVLIFDCFNGNLRKIFEKRYLYGVKIKKNTNSEITFISGDWQPDDPTCCPSREKKETYLWDLNKNSYILESAAPLPTD